MIQTIRYLSGALLCLALYSGMAWAQGGTAQINGSVTDPTGAVLPGVEVTATQTATGIARTAVTNETGSFVLPNLAVGPYRLEASLPGFRTFRQTGIVLQVGSSVGINPVLEVGEVAQAIEVQADAVMVETRATGIGEVIDNTRLQELPLIGRQATDLVVLAGAAIQTGVQGAGGRSFPGVPQFSIAGGLNRGTSFMLDGASHNDFRGNFGLPMPFPDALQEFKVETSAVPAQYGFRSGGALNAVTRSGTNEFHGGGFWFVRNEVFNARRWQDAERDPLKRNQFGGTIGGPIARNKVFFFFGYQGTTDRGAPSGTTDFVPTPAMIAGDFSTVAGPACGRNRTLPAPFENNRIDPSLFSPAAMEVVRRLPAAIDECGTTRWGTPNQLNQGMYVGRLDYQINDNHSLFGRYMGHPYDLVNPMTLTDNVLASGGRGQDNLFQSLTVGLTSTLGPNMVNTFRVGGNRSAIARQNPEFFDSRDLGIKNVWHGTDKMMVIDVPDWFSIGSRTSAPNTFNEGSWQVANDLGVIRGNHQINVGGLWLGSQSNNHSFTFTMGTWQFGSEATGLSIADFMLGRLQELEQGAGSFLYARPRVIGLYAQDSWQARPNVTLSYGLRWEPYIAVRYERDQSNFFDIDAFLRNERTSVFRNAPAGLFYPGDPQFPDGGNSTNPVKNHWNQWAPRVGLSWDPLGDGRTVIRGAYGIFRETQASEFFLTVGHGAPWAGKAVVRGVSFDDPYADVPGGNPFPFVPGPDAPYPNGGVYSTSFTDTKPAHVHQWNVGIQRQIAADWLVSAAYIGNYAAHTPYARELNPAVFIPGAGDADGNCFTTVRGQAASVNVGAGRPCSTTRNVQQRRVLSLLDADGSRDSEKFAFMSAWDDRGSRNYHGMLLRLNKRMSNNFSLTANWTWSHCVGHPTSFLLQGRAGTGVFNDGEDPDRDRGNCGAEDRRHIVNSTFVFRMPQFADPWMERLAGGWRLSGIFRAQSGANLTPTVTADRALTGVNVRSQRPNLVSSDTQGNWCTDDLRAPRPNCRWLNADAFAQPALGTLGSAGPFILRGPGSWTVDAGLARVFQITEGQQLEFRADASNVFNVVNWNNPTTSLGANFGRINGAGEPRIVQLGMRYTF